MLPQRYFALISFCVSPPFVPEFPAILWWILTPVLMGIIGVFVVRIDRPTARFGVLPPVLGCVPLTASVPFERLLVLSSGGMALVGRRGDQLLARPQPSAVRGR